MIANTIDSPTVSWCTVPLQNSFLNIGFTYARPTWHYHWKLRCLFEIQHHQNQTSNSSSLLTCLFPVLPGSTSSAKSTQILKPISMLSFLILPFQYGAYELYWWQSCWLHSQQILNHGHHFSSSYPNPSPYHLSSGQLQLPLTYWTSCPSLGVPSVDSLHKSQCNSAHVQDHCTPGFKVLQGLLVTLTAK